MIASGPVGIGVIGLGPRGMSLGESFHRHPSARLVAVCDRSEPRLRAAGSRLAIADLAAYATSAELLADPRVDAVIIAAHDKGHAAIGREALRAGKHVFLEKPMAQTVEDCDALIAAWQKTRTVFMVGLELRYCSLAQDMKGIVARGDIGEVRLGYAVDNVSVGGQYFFHDDYRRREYVSNLVLQKGVHTIDLMNWWIESDPLRVYAEGGRDVFGGDEANDKRCRDCATRADCQYNVPADAILDYGEKAASGRDLCVWAREVDVEDNTMVTVRYANGAKMTYIECHFTPDYNRHFTLIGTKGRMYGYYDNEQNFRIEVTYRHSGRRDTIFPEKRPGSHGGGDLRIRDEFIERILRGESSCPGIAGARNGTAIAAAAGLAMATGAPVDIPPCPLDPRSDP